MDPLALNIILKLVTGQQIHDKAMHEEICKWVLGQGYGYVHAFKDGPSKYLGKGHRILFHDQTTNVMMGLINRDSNAMIAGMLHDALDFGETRLRRNFRKY